MNQLKRFFSRKPVVSLLAIALVLVFAGAATTLLADKDSGKESTKGYLGVSIEKISMEDRDVFGANFGLLVIGVEKGDPAEKAGIKKYDVIQYFNGEKMHRPSDLTEAVRNCKPDSQAKIKLVRDKKEMELTATLGEAKFKDFSLNWNDGNGKKFFFKSSGAFLGVRLQKLSKDLAEYFGVNENDGALILKISKDSPAEKAGLKSGDVVLKLNGKNVSEPDDVSDILKDLNKGDKVDIDIIRHKKKQTVNVELDERDGFQGLRVLKDLSDGGRFHIRGVPEIRYQGLNDEDIEIIIKDKVEKKMKEAEKKLKNSHKSLENVDKQLEKVHKKLEKIEEKAYI